MSPADPPKEQPTDKHGGEHAVPTCFFCLRTPCTTLIGLQAYGLQHNEDDESFKTLQGLQLALANTKILWAVGEPKLPRTETRPQVYDTHDVREVMLHCVVKDIRNRWPNPPNVPYQGYRCS